MRRARLLLPALVLFAPFGPSAVRAPTEEHAAATDRGALSFAINPGFVANRGQFDPRAKYSLPGNGASAFFTDGGVRLGVTGPTPNSPGWGLALDFVGAQEARPAAQGETGAVVSYFHGGPEEWETGIPTYSRVVYRALWPGIDLVWRAEGPALKYSFRVAPGADPDDIRLGWRGADIRPTAGGGLDVVSPVGTLMDGAPISFQRLDGDRATVPTSYRVDGSTVGFEVDDYDVAEPLLVDPALLYAGYIGGSDADRAIGVAVDGAGSAYVVGFTQSMDLPTAVGPDPSLNPPQDGFAAKLNPAGTGLEYLGYLGGDSGDVAVDVTVDAAGSAYVSGFTGDDTFPTVGGPDSSYNGGPTDGFVTKIDPSGSALVYSGFVGGSSADYAFGIGVDGSGRAYLGGSTASGDFPAKVGPDLSFNGGGADGFVARVAPSGADLEYAGFIGGLDTDLIGPDAPTTVGVDPSGGAYVTGLTSTSDGSFPATVGPDTSYNGGTYDAFVAKVNPAGTGLDFAGFLGGSSDDYGLGIAVDVLGNAYVAGTTSSADFPALIGPDTTPGGGFDGFVAKVDASGTGLAYAGFVGGTGGDVGAAVDVDATGAAYVTGSTGTSDGSFPAAVGPDLSFNGGSDAWVARVSPSGTTFSYAGFVGGTDVDTAYAISVDPGGNAVLAGETGSTETAGFPVSVGPDVTYNGGSQDAFVAKVETVERCQGKRVTRLGSDQKDVLTGTAGKDVVKVYGGDDTIRTQGGVDRVCAGKGNDTVKGGAANDRLKGEGGRDALVGGPGRRDRCVGGPGRDTGKACERGRL